MNLQNEKMRLRKITLKRRRNLNAMERLNENNSIEKKFLESKEFLFAKVIAFYASKADEVFTDALIEKALEKKKKVLLPRATEEGLVFCEIKDLYKDVEIGNFAVREPADKCKAFPISKIDVMVIPLVAFDKKRNRLGYGKGFYDRALREFKGVSVGFAFRCQEVGKIPTESYDEKIDKVLLG